VNLTQALTAIERTYQDFQAGLPTSLQMSPGFSGAGNNEVIGMATIARLRRELFLLVLPRYVGAPPDTKAKPDESISEFLDRIDAEASASGQLELRVRVQQTQRLLNAADRASYQEVTGLNNFVAAQNQEAAGQIMLAVTSYQQALRSGNSLIPAEFIGTRLAALKEAHPDDYRQGMELFLTPPMPPRMMPGDMRSFPVGPTPTPQATLELAVPPIAKDSPAASPAADKSPSPAPAKTKP
jgi:hypothetical protein